MAKWIGGFLVLLVAAAAGLYLLVYQPQKQSLDAAQLQLAAAQREVASLRSRVADLESIRDQLQRTSTDLQEQVAAKEKELAALHSTQDELVEGLKQEIADRQVQVERIRDQIRVDMVDEILFDSGEAALKPAGKEVLQKLASVLAGSDRQIRVQGHTDDVPIAGRLAQTFPTNWELSAARAVNVVRFLQEGASLDPTHLSASALSQYRPRVPNDGPEGRQKNRRIEIVLEPAEEMEAPEPARQ